MVCWGGMGRLGGVIGEREEDLDIDIDMEVIGRQNIDTYRDHRWLPTVKRRT